MSEIFCRSVESARLRTAHAGIERTTQNPRFACDPDKSRRLQGGDLRSRWAG
jgi:hypothetical protein